jgi:hypothetical protein
LQEWLSRHYVETLFSELQDSIHLISSNAREPFQEVLNARAALQVLKKSPHRHTGSFENPRPANFAGLPFDCRTLAPIHHQSQFATKPPSQQAISIRRA